MDGMGFDNQLSVNFDEVIRYQLLKFGLDDELRFKAIP